MTDTDKLAQLASGYGLLEGARWYPEHGLVFSDMTAGGVYRLPPAGATASPETLIPHRKAIGGLVAHADGGFVVSGRNVSIKGNDGATTVLLEAAADEQFFNDITADGRGRLFAGSMPSTQARRGGSRAAVSDRPGRGRCRARGRRAHLQRPRRRSGRPAAVPRGLRAQDRVAVRARRGRHRQLAAGLRLHRRVRRAARRPRRRGRRVGLGRAGRGRPGRRLGRSRRPPGRDRASRTPSSPRSASAAPASARSTSSPAPTPSTRTPTAAPSSAWTRRDRAARARRAGTARLQGEQRSIEPSAQHLVAL